MILTYRYRIKDGNKAARRALRSQARAVNFVWNFCAETDRTAASRYRAGMCIKRPSGFDLANLCRGVTRELGIHSDTIDAICAKFADSRHACFPKTPRFRSAKRYLDWIPFSNFIRPARLDGDTLRFLGCDYRLWLSREIPADGKPKSWSLACDSDGHWFVNIQVELPDGERQDGASVGIDLGLKTLATLSDGTKIEHPRFFRLSADKIALHQRRKQKRQARKVAAKIARQRRHFLHVETARLSKKFSFIAIGDVSPSRLMKTRMAKSVGDAGWTIFKSMLAYKRLRTGSEVKIVNERYSSQMCSCCGCIPGSSPKGMSALGIRHWTCSSCGASLDRDINAARNILFFAGPEHRPPAEEIPVLYGGEDVKDYVRTKNECELPQGVTFLNWRHHSESCPIKTLQAIRERGWVVAVHNDYTIGRGKTRRQMTSWLFTNTTGQFVKGEGDTDAQACGRAFSAIMEIANEEYRARRAGK